MSYCTQLNMNQNQGYGQLVEMAQIGMMAEMAQKQAKQELGIVVDPRYQYEFRLNQVGQREIIPVAGSPADAMTRLQLVQERTNQILRQRYGY